jgi:hypothetical protein
VTVIALVLVLPMLLAQLPYDWAVDLSALTLAAWAVTALLAGSWRLLRTDRTDDRPSKEQNMKTTNIYYRLAVGVALATVLFLIWGVGALGINGEGGRPDRMYAGVLAVGAIGTVIARLRPRGMALALLATALAQALVAVIALVAGVQHTEGASVAEILGLNGMYAALFSLSAWLFRRAAEQHSAVAVSGGA